MSNFDVTWSDLSLFNESNIKDIPDNFEGVYRLSYKADDTKIYVFYVGKSEDLRSQLLNHLSEKENVCIKNYIEIRECYFKYAHIASEDIRSSAQRHLYIFYQPSCNSAIPIGDESITINVSNNN